MLKISYLTIKEWRKRLRQLTKNHMYKIQACKVIASEFKVNPNTVRYCLFQRRSYLNAKDYQEAYRNRPEIKTRRRDFDYRYKRLTRHIDSLLPQIFNSKLELSLGDISVGIRNLSEISLRERTLEKLLLKYENTERGPPILKTESGNY